jgi:small-conductance mechanosensitive channel
MVWEALAAVGVVLVRNVSGWLENALEDGEITQYEFRELGVTVFRIGVPGVLAALGLSVAGVDWAVLGGFVFAALWDVTIRKAFF